MTREKLLKIEGMTEEMADAVLELSKGYVPHERFNEVNEAKKNAEALIKERDAQIETLKSSAGDAEKLNATIAELQEANKKSMHDYEDKITRMKIDYAVEAAIKDKNGKNAKAIKALLNMENVQLGEDGAVTGITEQLEGLIADENSSFLFGSSVPEIKGFVPANNEGNPEGADLSKMNYAQLSEYFASANN